MDRIVKISCDEEDFILDPFCGSGSMGIAAYINNGIEDWMEFIHQQKG